MSELYVKDDTTWQNINAVYINQAGTWRAIKNIYVNQGGTWRLVFGGNSGTVSWTSAQTVNWTVPAGVYSISVNACGGGGGGGQADGGANFDGYGGGGGGANLKGPEVFSVVPGQVLSITVGAAGPANQGQGGYGGTSSVTGTGVSYSAVGGQGGQNYVSGSQQNAYTGQGAYGADWPTANYSRTLTPGQSYNGGSSGGRGGDGGDYRPGYVGQAGKVYITY